MVWDAKYSYYDGEKELLECGPTGGAAFSNVYGKGIDEILRRIDTANNWTLYYQQDANGNVTELTWSSGDVVEIFQYDAFGALNKAASGWGNPFLFTGRRYQSTFGIYEYRARAYHPRLGRFMSEDPKLFDAGDYNLFRYCHNDPLDLTDPMGLIGNDYENGVGRRSEDRMWDMAKWFDSSNTFQGTFAQFTVTPDAVPSQTKADKGRPLTSREVGEAKTVFHDKIDYDPVRVVNEKYFFLQPRAIAITPNNHIYFPNAPADFILGGGTMARLFIHEMTHVMQYQHGVNVVAKALPLQIGYYGSGKRWSPYTLRYNTNRSFSSYNVEQQGKIAEGIYEGRFPNNIDYSDLR